MKDDKTFKWVRNIVKFSTNPKETLALMILTVKTVVVDSAVKLIRKNSHENSV